MGCSAKEDVVAQVGEIELTSADFEVFVNNLPSGPNLKKDDPAILTGYLQSMVDQELLLLEAREQRIEDDPKVAGELGFLVRRRLSDLYKARILNPRIEINSQVLEREFVDSQLNKERLLSRILVRTDEDRDEILRQLAAGRPFDELVGPFAPNDVIASGDGLVGWFNHAEAQRRFRIPRRAFFSLAPGQVAKPVRLSRGWQIYRFLEDRTPDLADYFDEVKRRAEEKQWRARNREELEVLKKKLAVQFHPEALQLMRQRLGNQPLHTLPPNEDFGGQTLYSFEGGALSLAQAVVQLRGANLSGPLPDSSLAVDMFEDVLLTPLLYEFEARKRDWDQEPQYTDWYGRQHKKAVLTRLIERQAKAKIKLDQEEVLAYYEANKERFKTSDQVKIRQLMAPTAPRAKELRQALEAGASFGQLLVEKDVETNGKPRNGTMTLNPVLKVRYPQMVEAAFAAEEGEWVGPIETKDGHYAVFRVEQHEKAHIEPFDQARTRAEALLRQAKENELIASFIRHLREKYADRVVIFPDRLAQAKES